MKSVDADYEQAGPAFARALQILVEGCDVPPSFEVFSYELGLRRRRSSIGPERLAEALADDYRRYIV